MEISKRDRFGYCRSFQESDWINAWSEGRNASVGWIDGSVPSVLSQGLVPEWRHLAISRGSDVTPFPARRCGSWRRHSRGTLRNADVDPSRFFTLVLQVMKGGC